MKYKIRFIRPSFPNETDLIKDYRQIVTNNWYTNFGPFEQEFRKAAAKFIGSKAHATTVANATLGLDISIKALFDKTESCNKVIVPSFTFPAGPAVLVANGFQPVFIDIDRLTWQPDINDAREVIEKDQSSISGILLCNTFGVGNREIGEWEKLSKEYNKPLIIDSAAGFGSTYNGEEKLGVRGDCEIFSFHATKPFSIGEGGLVVSKSETLINKLRSIQNFGFDSNQKIAVIGTNAKLQELNCAIGIQQLQDFSTRLNGRVKTLLTYKNSLKNIGFKFQDNDQNSTVPFTSIIATSSKQARTIFRNLNDNGVEARKYYQPLHTVPIFTENSVKARRTLDVTEDIYSRIIALPVHDFMKESEINYVINLLKNN